MENKSFRLLLVVFALILVSLTACVAQPGAQPIAGNPDSSTPTAVPTPPQSTFTDPFAYCASIGTIDAPNARYTGPQVPEAIINGFVAAAGLQGSTEPLAMFQKTTTWRCMDNQVYACNFGANLPCSSKANTEKTPSQAMVDFCVANPDAAVIPMSVTGHSTIYSWRCVKDTPEPLDQIEKVDAQGYLAQIWYAIQPNAPVFTPAPDTPPAPEVTPTPTLLGGSGQLLFASNRGGAYEDLYLLDFNSSQIARLTQGDSNSFPGPFSPDGSRIVFTGFGLTTSYIGVMNADGSHPVNLTNKDVDEGFPAWSPDGSLIAFTSRRDGNNEIYVMNADGSNQKRLTNSPKDDFAPAWSPDRKQIAFVSDRDNSSGIYSIYLMNADGSGVKRLTSAGSDYTPAWSPDGAQIAFRSIQNGSSDIWTIRPDGSSLKNLTNHPAEDWSPAWSPDGSLIAFQTNRDGNWEIYVMNADGSDPRNLTQNPADDQMPYWQNAVNVVNQPQAEPLRVSLEPGSTSANIQGQIGADGKASYLVAVKAGQYLMASIDNYDQPLYLEIQAPDGSTIVSADSKLSYWQGVLGKDGDYLVSVLSAGKASNLSLSLTLPVRVQFAAGATSASFEGKADANGIVTYMLRALQGQTMTVTITSPQKDIFLTIYGLQDGTPYIRSAADATTYSFLLPSTQDYVIKLVSTNASPESYKVDFVVK